MLDELAMAYQVIMRPNSTFATLRDDDRRYFQPSIVLMLLLSVAYAGFGLATPAIAGEQAAYAASSFGLAILGIVASAGTTYLLGRAFGGNKSWRKVFTVIFYMEIVEIPVAAVSALSSLQSPSLEGVVFGLVIAVLVWAIIVNVKAIKVLNGFGTAKAFGIGVLSGIIQLIWLIPVALLLYLPIILSELPNMQTPLQ